MRSAVRSSPALAAVPTSPGSGASKVAGLTCSRDGEDAGDLVVAPAERAQHQEAGRLGLRQHDPLAASCLHERAHLERRKLSRGHCVTFITVSRRHSGSGPPPWPSRCRAR